MHKIKIQNDKLKEKQLQEMNILKEWRLLNSKKNENRLQLDGNKIIETSFKILLNC